MKSLFQYILEEYNTFRCKDVNIPFDILVDGDTQISFQVPAVYSEDDLQIYLQDLYLEKMPGNNKDTQDKLGINYDNLFDTNFEYEEYVKSDEEPNNFIEWDESYDNRVNKNDDEFGYITLSNLKYYMKFDIFDIDVESETDIHDTIIQIFNTMNIENDKDLPFDLILDEKNIEYK